MKIRCFIDVNEQIWSINQKGESNFPGDIEVTEGIVRILGDIDSLGLGREVVDEYQLWPSLTSLAMAIEQSIDPNDDGSVTLEQAVAEAYLSIQSFEEEWRKQNNQYPDRYPMSLPQDNAGLWFEQISDHSNLTQSN